MKAGDCGMLERTDGFILDLDGTVYKGTQAIDGAAEAIARLRRCGKRVAFLSNRGNMSRRMCRAKLEAMGIAAEEREIILTSFVAAAYLKETDPDAKVWTLGDPGLREELAAHGVALAERPEQAEWLVVTLHETLTYDDLNQAFRAVRHGARIIATNADRMFPGDKGDSIDVAGMIGAIAYSTGKEPEIVLGKPSTRMADAALRTLGLPAERCLIVGDSLASDIELGRRAGIRTALVLTGSTRLQDVAEAPHKPDVIWTSLRELDERLKELMPS